MVNQLLAGVHIASAAEAMAFAVRLNLRTRRVFEIMQHARGYSWYISLIIPFLVLVRDSESLLNPYVLNLDSFDNVG